MFLFFFFTTTSQKKQQINCKEQGNYNLNILYTPVATIKQENIRKHEKMKWEIYLFTIQNPRRIQKKKLYETNYAQNEQKCY